MSLPTVDELNEAVPHNTGIGGSASHIKVYCHAYYLTLSYSKQTRKFTCGWRALTDGGATRGADWRKCVQDALAEVRVQLVKEAGWARDAITALDGARGRNALTREEVLLAFPTAVFDSTDDYDFGFGLDGWRVFVVESTSARGTFQASLYLTEESTFADYLVEGPANIALIYQLLEEVEAASLTDREEAVDRYNKARRFLRGPLGEKS